jgi:DNA-binding HxlR family transcriptional regulator
MAKRKLLNCAEGCPVEAALELIGGKWKGVVLYHLLKEGKLRFGELRRKVPTVTVRMLTRQLRELEKDRLVHRRVYPEVPPKVIYSLTEKGSTLRTIVRALEKWGIKHAADRP